MFISTPQGGTDQDAQLLDVLTVSIAIKCTNQAHKMIVIYMKLSLKLKCEIDFREMTICVSFVHQRSEKNHLYILMS